MEKTEAPFDISVTIGNPSGNGIYLQGNLEKNDEMATNPKLQVHFGVSPQASDHEVQQVQEAIKVLTEKIFESDKPTIEVALVNGNQDVLVTVEFASGQDSPFSQLEGIVPLYAPANLSFTLETSENFSTLNLLQPLYLKFAASGVAYVDILESLPFLQSSKATLLRKLLVNNLGLTLHLKLKDVAEAMTNMAAEFALGTFPLLNWEAIKQLLQTKVNSASNSAKIWTPLLVGAKALSNVNKIVVRAADRKLTITANGLDIWNVFQTTPPQEQPQVNVPYQQDAYQQQEIYQQEVVNDVDLLAQLEQEIGRAHV